DAERAIIMDEKARLQQPPTPEAERVRLIEWARNQMFDVVRAWDTVTEGDENAESLGDGNWRIRPAKSWEEQARMVQAMFDRITATYGVRRKKPSLDLLLTPRRDWKPYFEDLARPFYDSLVIEGVPVGPVIAHSGRTAPS